jgi:ATP-dependent RNA helicase RhlE
VNSDRHASKPSPDRKIAGKRPTRRRRKPTGNAADRPAPSGAAHSAGSSTPHLDSHFQRVDAPTDPVSFDSLNLDSALLIGVRDRHFVQTTPIQSATWSIVSSGDDLVACAQTGTGKTAAFLLPLMQELLQRRAAQPPVAGEKRHTRVLVLAPTRELAVQIEDDFQGFAYHAGLTGIAVYGGVAMQQQEAALRAGVDFVVATPGRLMDHMRAGATDFSRLEALVLDEADRMLDMGFWPDVRRIVSSLPSSTGKPGAESLAIAGLSDSAEAAPASEVVPRQTLLFSATMPDEVLKLAVEIMHEAKYVQVGQRGNPAATITHLAYAVPLPRKVDWLCRFLRQQSSGPTLVFSHTKHGADKLAQRLSAARIRCGVLHADRTQVQRMQAVEGFRAGRHKVLVATDIAARGLDIDGIEHVVNFEVPRNRETYVHRVGRAGRADATGTAITLVAPEERRALEALERAFNLKLNDGHAHLDTDEVETAGRTNGSASAPAAAAVPDALTGADAEPAAPVLQE